jgi:hypothetical protein
LNLQTAHLKLGSQIDSEIPSEYQASLASQTEPCNDLAKRKIAIITTSFSLQITIFITDEWYATQFLQLIKNTDSVSSAMLYQNTWKKRTSRIWLKKEPEFFQIQTIRNR